MRHLALEARIADSLQQVDKPPLYYKPAGVFPEDVFRCMTQETKIRKNYVRAFKGKHDMAMSRFELEAA